MVTFFVGPINFIFYCIYLYYFNATTSLRELLGYIIIFYIIFFNMVCNFLGAQGDTKNPLKLYCLVIVTSVCRHQGCSNLSSSVVPQGRLNNWLTAVDCLLHLHFNRQKGLWEISIILPVHPRNNNRDLKVKVGSFYCKQQTVVCG